ncbi:protein kinase domain-containing protein [Streptomyces agglomeratus]|uniref:protein kinase domain-containing protein n=1 Tax=Streptomyces agglomeratus TaxID=285458 RepID=UPI0009A08B54|nr:protein kinase [Streptomyces agglomeratus]
MRRPRSRRPECSAVARPQRSRPPPCTGRWRRRPGASSGDCGLLDGRYRLIQSIGAGGCQVWAAHDPKIDRLVAVKVLTGDANSSRQVARFAREAAVAGGLAHPNIVTVHDFGSTTHNGRPCAYMVMELLPGKPLSGALKTGRLPLPQGPLRGGLRRRRPESRTRCGPDAPGHQTVQHHHQAARRRSSTSASPRAATNGTTSPPPAS